MRTMVRRIEARLLVMHAVINSLEDQLVEIREEIAEIRKMLPAAFTLSARDAQRFLDAIANPPEPSEALRAAAKEPKQGAGVE